MSEKNLINGQVWFDPDGPTLTSAEDPGIVIPLPVPAGRCLVVLLSHHGEVITIRQFHEWVWNENKSVVSDNTIYQNISVLRKSLADAGAGKQIIETQTRRGWKIPMEVSIELHETSLPLPESIPLPTQAPVHDFIKPEAKKHNSTNRLWLHLFVSVIALVASLTTFIVIYQDKKTAIPSSEFSKYKSLSVSGDCHLYRNDTQLPDSVYQNLISKHNMICGDLTWWYITLFTTKGPASVIMCRHPIQHAKNGPEDCTSVYFRGY